MLKVKIRDIVLSDFEYQLEITKFYSTEDSDNSYHYMLTQLEIHYKDKNKNDNSLTKRDVQYIKDILDNVEAYTLKQAYENIITFLKAYKCKMTYKERQKYFAKRFNKDAGVYLMEALSIICNKQASTTGDYYQSACNIGMCNSEALDFLDAYNHPDGWIEEYWEE